jgi:hypothetical protein
MSINIDQLMTEIKAVASGVINQDIAVLSGFSERQLKALAKQTELIASSMLSGEIDDDLQVFFLDSLKDMALNFVKTFQGLVMVTIEKVWNAIVGVLWGAISSVTGINLIAP